MAMRLGSLSGKRDMIMGYGHTVAYMQIADRIPRVRPGPGRAIQFATIGINLPKVRNCAPSPYVGITAVTFTLLLGYIDVTKKWGNQLYRG